MIYIATPYNTGSDLVYNDDFSKSTTEYIASSGYLDENGNRLVENLESNGRYHTDWLNMIYSRLRLAKDLLATNGVIFVSLDDNESANLKKICDEVFGAVNFIGQITVVGNPRGRDYGGVARMLDYLFVYKKSPANGLIFSISTPIAFSELATYCILVFINSYAITISCISWSIFTKISPKLIKSSNSKG